MKLTPVNMIKIFLALAVVCAGTGLVLERALAQKGKRYSEFDHRQASHKKIACNSCHHIPSANSRAVSGFPNVTDYPGHASCVQCHREQFFRGNHPEICKICHVESGPRGQARLKFPVPTRSGEFNIIFPHNIHQDVIAQVKPAHSPANAAFFNASFAAPNDDKKPRFNNCSICHVTPRVLPKYSNARPLETGRINTPLAAMAESFAPTAEFFKDMPRGHASCFSCHYQQQQPVATNCAGCHQMSTPHFDSAAIRRFSLKFNHESKNHVGKDCTTCHIRITQNSDLRTLTSADVPILTCATSSCHLKELKAEIDSREKSLQTKTSTFQCNYCHTIAIGSYQVPRSHQQIK
jgi:transcription initiation factor TFIIIB Brf1 subunit/transcription initiation factor TFIIB